MLKKGVALQIFCVVTIVNALWLSLMDFHIETIAIFGIQNIFGVSLCLWLMQMRQKYAKKGK